jgi:hypothetical protein
MAKVVKGIAAVGLIVAGALTGNVGLILAGASIGASLFVGAPKGTARQASSTSLQLGEQPRQAMFGLGSIGGTLLDGFNFGGKYGTDWEVLAIALADHLCDALVGFYVGDAYVTFAGNGQVTGYNGKLIVTWYQGTAAQAADPTLVAQGGWSTADTLAGVCYVVVQYKADADNEKHPTWPSGRPQFSWIVRGKRCYDPRQDSTVAGGSGAHRWSDPSTWQWTDNLAICRYNWVRGVYACDRVGQPDQLLVGRGLSEAEAPPARVAMAANLCAEPVAKADGGTEPRYAVSALIGADEVFADVEAKFAAACGGVIVQPEGSIEVEPGHAKAPVAYITDADLIAGKPVTFSSYRSEADEEWCNTVVPKYIEPTQKWQDHAAPIRRVVADLVADGGPREKPLDLAYVTSSGQAQRCGEIARRMGRLWRTATPTLGPRFCELEEGDWIVWTSARRTKGLPVTFRIEAYSSDASWQTGMQLREISADVFAWSAGDEAADGAVASQQVAPDSAAYINLQPTSAAIAVSFPLGLTITAAGDGTITIGNHTRRYTDGHADVAVTGATVASGLGPGDFRAIYYDDPDRVGGAVTYGLDADDIDARVSPANPGRHYVGYVTVPAAGSPPAGAAAQPRLAAIAL